MQARRMDRQCQRRSAGRPAPVLVGGHAAATREDATEAIGLFVQTCQAKYPDGAECLAKGQGRTPVVLRLPRRALEAPADRPTRT
jgi:hypothetical protein